MKKLRIDEYAKLEQLKNFRIWSFCVGVISLLLAMVAFPHATRSPGAMATSAFSAFVEAGWMAWMVIPMLVIGVTSIIFSLILWWRIKKVSGENSN